MEPDNQEAQKEIWEERAAIMEFDAGMSRAQAERRARRELQHSPACSTEPPVERQTPGYLAFREFWRGNK
jgi:hypothetical protein